MDIQGMTNDEIRPTCPKCGGRTFAAVMNREVLRTIHEIPMIVCADTKCLAVVGVLPIGTELVYHLPDT